MNQNDQDQDLSDNNPLALNDNNPWQQYFADSEIRKIIRQDVERTFPDIEFFRQEDAQQRLTDILFIYCKLNRDVSYRQGMHELLAPFYWILKEESLDSTQLDINPIDPINQLLVQLLDSNYAEHDAYILFDRLMKHGKAWYEFNEQTVPVNKKNSTSNRADIRSNPIVAICHRIHHQHLKTIDPYLYQHLENFGIEPQLYGIRWIRLLFGREFEIHELLKLWDAIFAQDRTLEIVEYVCLAILLRMRDQLLNKDYAECLSMLMRPSEQMKPAGLVEQARYLKDNLTEETALQILQQLDVRSGRDPRPSMSAGVPELHIQTPSSAPPARRTLNHKSSQLDGFSRLTSNMMRNSQMRDLNRAIAGVMGTVQKNVNTFNENVLGKPQDLNRRSTVSSEFPSGFDRLATSNNTQSILSSPAQSQKLPLADEQLNRLKATNQEMGELMARCISLLEVQMFPALDASNKEEEISSEFGISSDSSDQEVSPVKKQEQENNQQEKDDSQQQQEEKKQKEVQRPLQDDATIIMALVGLKHVRDVLIGKQTHFDSSVLDFKSSSSQEKKKEEWKWDLVDAKEATPSNETETPSAQTDIPPKLETPPSASPKADTPPPSTKRTSVFIPPQTTSPLLNAEAYVSNHPVPPKQPIKYRIEDLLSDPDLQIPSPKANHTKFKWILENNHAESPVVSQQDLFKPEPPKLSPRKRASFILKRQSSQVDMTSKSSVATIDPLDAKNVDSRKAYEYDVF
ncbi:rab-GTPase-TBC domain-containing protein [Choanephora cucurbitarum]|nr:rab-GTPase-TBC domain-containing protein [Choanephora cucurbitarum]